MMKSTRQVLAAAARSAVAFSGLAPAMGLEPLEGRQMMTATAAPAAPARPIELRANGVLKLTGSLTVGNTLRVDEATTGATGTLTATVDGRSATFGTSTVKRVVILGGSGNDVIYVDPRVTAPALIIAGAGSDTVTGGDGHATIRGGAGDDVVYIRGGHNVVFGGLGNDTVVGAGGSDDVLVTAAQADRAGGLGGGHDMVVQSPATGADASVTGQHRHTKTASPTRSISITPTATQTTVSPDARVGGLGNGFLYAPWPINGGTTVAAAPPVIAVSAGPTAAPAPVVVAAPPAAATPTVSPPPASTITKTPASTTTPAATPTSTRTPTATPTPIATATPKPAPKPTPTATPTKAATPSQSAVQPAVMIPGGTAVLDSAALAAPSTPGGTTADGRPVAVLQVMPGPRQAGLVVNVDGLASRVGTGLCDAATYAWNFGDPAGAHNAMTGYNAAHVYDAAGTYTVTLTVTNAAGQTSVAQGTVTVAASSRASIYVDATHGNDANAGTLAAPLKTLAAAAAKVTDGTQVLLRAGQTFADSGISLNSTNVLVGRYGDGADPTLTDATTNSDMITSGYGTDGLTIEHLTFDTPNAVATNAPANKVGIRAIVPRGSNVTVRDCTFLNVDDAVNEFGNPEGTLVEDNSAPLVTGLRAYMVWGQGVRNTILGNTVANSTREHNVRVVTGREFTIEDNTLTNTDRESTGDPGDGFKGCIEMQQGSFGYIDGNSATDGEIRIGPRGAAGEDVTDETAYSVVRNNRLTNAELDVKPGAHHATIADNVITWTWANGGYGIEVDHPDAYGRISGDINVGHNTMVNTGKGGSFLRLTGQVNGISLTNNLYIAPNVVTGWETASAVYVEGPDLRWFTRIADNVWPAKTASQVAGGVNVVSATGDVGAYETGGEWNANPQVQGDDAVQDLVYDDLDPGSYQISAARSASGVTVGSSLARAA